MSNKKITELVFALKGKDSYEELEIRLRAFGVNVSASSLRKYVSSTNDTRFPSYETLIGLYEYAKQGNIKVPSVEDINKELKGDNVSALRRSIPMRIDPNYDIISVPIIGRVPAGGPVLSEENIEGTMPVLNSFVRDLDNTFCLKVRGDSMIDVGIEDGDYVLVHSQNTAENGQTVIARIDGEVTCKRFYLMTDKVRLEPANIKYKAIESRNVEIVGVVTKIIKNLD